MNKTIKFLTTGLMGCLLSANAIQSFAQTSVPKTGVTFKTSDQKLQQLYDQAEKKAQWNIADFGKYHVLVEGAEYKNVWLETQPMGGLMYAKRDIQAAKDNICIFIDYQREDGRLPGMIHYTNGQKSPYYESLPETRLFEKDKITAHYCWFQGYCFPMPAFELYFWLGKDRKYLEKLYSALEKFDEYLWKTRDSDNDGCLETWGIWDTGEDNSTRYGNSPSPWGLEVAPTEQQIKSMTEEELKKCCRHTSLNLNNFPVPIESMDIMSYSYTGRDVLAKISKELNNGKEDYWRNKADDVRAKIKSYLWNEKKHACYDRDKNNEIMDILIHNNLRCMYFGSFDQQMADDFIKYHLMNPDEFWTPTPLPSIAANDPFFRNNSGNDWSGQPEGLTFQRSIRAMENYGHYAELSMIGQKFIEAMADSLKFTQQIDPFTSKITPNLDGYGPSILASLEFISRMYGIHITQDKIYWSCLDNKNNYSYSQQWGNYLFKMTTGDNRVSCLINGKEVFSFTKGARVISDLSGKIIEVAGIEPEKKKIKVTCKGGNNKG